MCTICDPETGEMAGCQDCGQPICFDVPSGDDVKSGDDVRNVAYVTCAGDICCTECGLAHDLAEADADEDEPPAWLVWLPTDGDPAL